MRNASILCVYENPAVLDVIKMLRGAGHTVAIAHNAADGVLLLRVFRFDMLLLDCVPAFTWLTEEAKRRPGNVRVAMCTDVPGFFQLPCIDAVLQEPLAAPILLQKVNELLETHACRDAMY